MALTNRQRVEDAIRPRAVEDGATKVSASAEVKRREITREPVMKPAMPSLKEIGDWRSRASPLQPGGQWMRENLVY